MKLANHCSAFAGIAAALFIWVSAFSDFAATTNIMVGPGGTRTFSPNIVTISTGDRIIWTWQSSNHSTTSGAGSPSGLWDSGVHNTPFSFTNSFPSAGNFPFYCTVHFANGMTGAVTVVAADLPPTVTITNPPAGFTFSAPASFSLAATASDSDGTVAGVQFFQGATSLGAVSSSPYSVAVNNLSAGDYALSAVATDNGGLMATNAITIHVVTPMPIVLSAPQFFPPAHFRFDYTANTNLSYIVQRSADLTGNNWTTLGTNLAGGSPVIFDDTNASTNPAYYRVGLRPNP